MTLFVKILYLFVFQVVLTAAVVTSCVWYDLGAAWIRERSMLDAMVIFIQILTPIFAQKVTSFSSRSSYPQLTIYTGCLSMLVGIICHVVSAVQRYPPLVGVTSVWLTVAVELGVVAVVLLCKPPPPPPLAGLATALAAALVTVYGPKSITIAVYTLAGWIQGLWFYADLVQFHVLINILMPIWVPVAANRISALALSAWLYAEVTSLYILVCRVVTLTSLV